MVQEQSPSFWENISVLFSQPGESQILVQPGGGDSIVFPGRTFFPGWKKEGAKKQNMIDRTRRETKFPRKIRSEKSSINFNNIYLFYHPIRYFMFPRSKVSTEQMFQRTAVVDYWSVGWFTKCVRFGLRDGSPRLLAWKFSNIKRRETCVSVLTQAVESEITSTETKKKPYLNTAIIGEVMCLRWLLWSACWRR